MINICPDECIDFFTVSALEGTEEADVKRLSYVGGIRGKVDRDNVMVFAVRFKLD